MPGDNLIQKSLFGSEIQISNNKDNSMFDDDYKNLNVNDLSNDQLKEDSLKRPRIKNKLTKQSTKIENHPNKTNNHDAVINKSTSYKTVDKSKLAPVLNHYVLLI